MHDGFGSARPLLCDRNNSCTNLPQHCSTLSPYPAVIWHPGSRVKAAQRRSLRREALTRLSGCHIFAYGDEVEAVSSIASELQTTVAIKIAHISLQCNAAG